MFSWICVVVATCQPVVINSVSTSTLRGAEAKSKSAIVTNEGGDPQPSRTPSSKSLAIDEQLRLQGQRLKAKYLSAGGIRRAALAGSEEYKKMQELANELENFDLSSLKTANEKKAFWINVYNALAIHGLVLRGHADTKSVLDIPEFFARTAYRIGGLDWSLDQIEHGVLRANSKPPFTFMRTLYRGQRPYALKANEVDPRIHFALNCGAKSCPPIAFYSPDHLDDQLNNAVFGFLQAESYVQDGDVFTSKIFDWYKRDFKPSVREFMLSYTEGELHNALASPDVDILYVPYQWDVE